jgi:isocitrate lyase
METAWQTHPRRQGVVRPYSAQEVARLRGRLSIVHSFAENGANRLWELLQNEPYVNALGAVTGNQAVQMVAAALKAIYCSGWQVAADANLASQTYPDQSLYPANSVPALVSRINHALQRADQIECAAGQSGVETWYLPIVADAEAGFGGVLNTFELMKSMIAAGAAGVHFEDQLSSEKKCGHLGGKVLVPAREFISKLVAARLATDVCGVPTLIVARTDAEAAQLLTSDIDPLDQRFIVSGPRTREGFFRVKSGLAYAAARAVAYAPYADLVWCETAKPDLGEAREFAEEVHRHFPGKMLMYNCSPSFNWKRHLDDAAIAEFQNKLGEMGYKFQFITLAGFHSLNTGMFELAYGYARRGMSAYVELQEREFALESLGYAAVKHQSFVGTGYFDQIQDVVNGGEASTVALSGSTEAQQFEKIPVEK